jgi:pilus assembly protein Flp/PilA
MRLIRSMLRDESGATAIEYGLIAALIGTAVVGGMGAYGTQLGNLFNKVSVTLTDTVTETR